MLSNAQLATLKTDILADLVFVVIPNTLDGAFEIAQAYNLLAAPNYTVWKTSVSTQEIMENGFIWTTVDSLTAGKARIWDWMTRLGQINPSRTNVRQGLADAFGAGSAMATAILPFLKRLSTRAEKLFATGTGSDASPGTMTFEGNLTYQEVYEARNLP